MDNQVGDLVAQLQIQGAQSGLNLGAGGNRYQAVDIPQTIKWPQGVKKPRNIQQAAKDASQKQTKDRAVGNYENSFQYRMFKPLMSAFIQVLGPQNLRMSSQNRLFVPKQIIQQLHANAQKESATLLDYGKYYSARAFQYARNLLNMWKLANTTQDGFQSQQAYYGSAKTQARTQLQQLRQQVKQAIVKYTDTPENYDKLSTELLNTYQQSPTTANYKRLMIGLGASTTQSFVTSNKLQQQARDAYQTATQQSVV